MTGESLTGGVTHSYDNSIHTSIMIGKCIITKLPQWPPLHSVPDLSISFHCKGHTKECGTLTAAPITDLPPLWSWPCLCTLHSFSPASTLDHQLGKKYHHCDFATSVNWISNLIVSMTFLTLTDHLGQPILFGLYAALRFLGLVFFVFPLLETKGKSLERILKKWNNCFDSHTLSSGVEIGRITVMMLLW